MTTPLLCLLGFVAWTLALVTFGIGSVRVGKVLMGKARAKDFPADVPHGEERYRRTLRAHINCVENLPLFGSVVLVGAVSGFASVGFDRLAVVYLLARIGQSVAHIASGRNMAINIRFGFFLTQVVCLAWMITMLVA